MRRSRENFGILRCKNAQILEIFRAARAQEKIQSELDILLPPNTVSDPFCPPGHLPDAPDPTLLKFRKSGMDTTKSGMVPLLILCRKSDTGKLSTLVFMSGAGVRF